ncbi:Lysyl-tRNA synthetase- class II [Striga hermonthica]|uniref:lysine--tRNA ligase n=1 Tax=Striga hermonthica TaxID=68872 RepID=A0A9N7RFK0_STRHE|nr:Lysyl-tRNA synthetase- class II [Striga hermonthica]
MEGLLHPLRLKHLLHLTCFCRPAKTNFLFAKSRPFCTVRCSSTAAAAAAVAPGGRNRRTSSSTTSTSDREAIRAIRIKKVEDLRSKGLDPYAYKWERTHTANQLQEIYRDLENGEESNGESDNVSIAGRIVARRAFGKLAFLTLRDDSGTIQLYCEKERLLSDQFELLKALVDIGDILGATGSIKRTEKGICSCFVLVSNSGELYRGLSSSNSCAIIAYTLEYIISEIRKTVESAGFIEVETPVLQGAAGGAEARPFITYHNSLGQDLYLRIATELHLKRMLVGGFERVYEIGRIFRNEGLSTRHNPEFTTIEMYEAYSDYESMMNMAEDIITRCALAVNGKLTLDYQGTEISLERPWRRETMHNLVQEATRIDFNEFGDDLTTAKQVVLETLDICRDNQIKSSIEACSSVGHMLNEVFELVVEPQLVQPTFVLDYPLEVSPLAKPHRRRAGLTERFELFVCGREMANAFSELTDPLDQRERLEEQVRQHEKKKSGLVLDKKEDKSKEVNDEAYDVTLDEDFVTALEYGMPPASGLGLGIDRLVMLLTNSASIRDVIAFPVLKTTPQH